MMSIPHTKLEHKTWIKYNVPATYPDVSMYASIFRAAPDFKVSRNPVLIGTSEEEEGHESTDGEIAQVRQYDQSAPFPFTLRNTKSTILHNHDDTAAYAQVDAQD